MAGPLARVIGEVTDQFNKANAGAIEVVPVYSGDYDPTQLDDAVDGKVSPKEAMDAVQKQVTRLIAK